MNTTLSRLNAVFAFGLTVLAVLTFLCFLSTVYKDRRSETNIATTTPVIVDLGIEAMASGPEQNDHAQFKFTIEANLSRLFDWNTKQLFVMLIVHYGTAKNVVNQVVIWDKIILRGDSPILDFRNVASKYEFFDDGMGFLGNKNVTLELCWNAIPHAGLLPLIRSGSHKVPFPNHYSRQRQRM